MKGIGVRISLAIDDSDYSDAATQSLLERPWPKDTTVRVLSVCPRYLSFPGPYAGDGLLNDEQLVESFLKRAQELVEFAATKLGALDLAVKTRVRQGEPREEILLEGKDFDADLIVVGSHGRTGLRRLLLGRVAEHIVRHAPCSVEVVRRPAIEASTEQAPPDTVRKPQPQPQA
jgi:nucleotide-binding universal stress UspA family protein